MKAIPRRCIAQSPQMAIKDALHIEILAQVGRLAGGRHDEQQGSDSTIKKEKRSARVTPKVEREEPQKEK
jgi:hypothetical protein